MRRRVKGDRAFKKLIKRLPQTVAKEMEIQLEAAGRDILAEQQAKVPTDTGKLRQALAMKLLPKTLRLRVGLLTKAVNKRFFYGRIVEFGRKAQTVIATRNGALSPAVRAAGGRSNNYKALALKMKSKGAYLMKIRGMAPRPFIYSIDRERIYEPFRKVWDRALAKAASGVTDE